MCTALTLKTKDFYFGRTLDLDRSYGEEVCIIPRNYAFEFRLMEKMNKHYAIIGMATIVKGEPLFYDGCNEFGLAMAGLNFPGNAYYGEIAEGKDNIAPFEFIPWILGSCKTVEEAIKLLNKINLPKINFMKELPLSPLHWIIADKDKAITVEFMKDGMHIYENEYGILTNNPPFLYHLDNLKKYEDLRNDNRDIIKNENLEYVSYCQGLGAVGLPGDVSSMSRFVRISFGKKYSICDKDESSSVSQFFHLLNSVMMIKGICVTDENTFDITRYTSCMNTQRGLYYYTTYNNRRITCVNLYKTDLDSDDIKSFKLINEESIEYQN